MKNIAGSTPTEKVTTAIAGAATTSPIWLDHLSGVAAAFIPILGCLWLIIQIGGFIWETHKDNKKIPPTEDK